MQVAEAHSTQSEAFRFVTALAQELSSGRIELPGIPDVAARVRRALDDDRVTADRLERIVSSEPVLASRIIRFANSAALNLSGRKVTDLPAAINRIGFGMVRSLSMAFALSQLRRSGELQGIAEQLNALWSRSTLVAAMCRVVAARISRVNPETAMLAGLLHGIGELYVLMRISSFPSLATSEEGRSIVHDWQGSIAKAILENWELDEAITVAVAEYGNYEREHEGPVDLGDVLTVAFLLASYMNHPDSLELNMADVRVCQRLELKIEDYTKLIESSREQIGALREALDY